MSRTAAEVRARIRQNLNDAIRRPGMYGSLQAESCLADLAFAEGRQSEAMELGKALIKRGGWSSTGVSGAFELITPPGFDHRYAGPTLLAEFAFEMGWFDPEDWLEPDTTMEIGSYWRLSNLVVDWLSDRPRTAVDVLSEYGLPSIRIGGLGSHVLGYTPPETTLPPVWFDIDEAGTVVACRRRGANLAEDFIYGPSPAIDTESARKSIASRADAPLPFFARVAEEGS